MRNRFGLVVQALVVMGACGTWASALTVPKGFTIETIAQISGARELAALPNGDLLVGTLANSVYIVPNAEGSAAQPRVFATIDDVRAAGVTFSRTRHEIYVGSSNHVWAIAYHDGMREATHVRRIADVRTGPIAPHSDGDIHTTTSVAFDDITGVLFVSVGSSCNACTEADPTRASIMQMHPDDGNLTKRATRIRNGIALFIDATSGALWVGDAGQDTLPFGHPYEFLDDVTSHQRIADYGWPDCEEQHHAYTSGADCDKTVAPIAEIPAYSTIVGGTFYPTNVHGVYAFPQPYRGGIFAAAHGSWHRAPSGGYAAQPQVVFIAMNGDTPTTPVDWDDPSTQWKTFVGGFQTNGRDRVGRPTGVAVGSQGSLFVADDSAGVIYRIRPTH